MYIVRTSHTITYENNTVLTVTNQPEEGTDKKYESLTINKVSSSGAALQGAKFSLYTDENGTSLVKELGATDADGKITISAADSALESYLPAAGETKDLYLKETEAPLGYELVGTAYKITISATDSSAWNADHTQYITTTTYSITSNGLTSLRITNTKTDSTENYEELTIHKTDAVSSSESLAGAVFTVYSDESCTNRIVELPETGEDGLTYLNSGNAALDGIRPTAAGSDVKIYIKETTAPSGYTSSEAVHTAVLTYTETGSVKTYGIKWAEESDTKSLTVTNDRKTETGDSTYGSLTIYKVDEDEQPLSGAIFTLYSDEACTSASKIKDLTATATNGSVSVSTEDADLKNYLPAVDETKTIYLKETSAPEGFSLSETVYTLTLHASQTSEWKTGEDGKKETYVTTTHYTIDNSGKDTITVVDEAIVNLKVVKTWDKVTPSDNAEVTVTLTKNGSKTAQKLKLKAPEWSGSFTNLPKFDDNGFEITYGVIEENAEGYSVSYTLSTDGKTLTVKNAPSTEKTKLSVTKSWQGGAKGTQAVVELLQNGKETGRVVVLTSGEGWTGTFEDLPKYDTNGNPYDYSVVEKTIGFSSAVVTTKIENGEFVSNVVNKPSEEMTSLKVTKTWDAGAKGESATVVLTINGVRTDREAVLDVESQWTATFDELQKYDLTGKEIEYGVEEVDAHYNVTVTTVKAEDGTLVTTVSNKPSEEVTKLEVTKEWADGASGESATVELTKNGEGTGKTVVLNEKNNWHDTFEDLLKYDSNGKEIEYSVIEKTNNYTVTVETEKQDDGTFVTVVTNRPSTEKTSVSVEKKWADGAKGEEAVIVLTKNGQKTDTKITLTEKNGWKGTFENLPKYGSDGKEITYGVEEETSNWNYTVESDGKGGFVVTNYPKNSPKNIKTGDLSRMGLWTTVLLAAVATAVVLYRRRRHAND